ncbi:MAG: DUF2063 domain-containing protein [Gammaproteobacteria bacterium]|nr:MAG: DUF2063 domain-containing protein [Gammaproteobacteria bacterium]
MHGDERPAFQRHQFAFTAHLRDPERVPVPPGVEERRMAVYRELVYNNIESFLASAFPVLRSIDSDAAWHRRVRRFLIDHRARSPFFADIPREFLQYLERQYEPQEGDPPFLLELAHYEWVELALSVSEETLPDRVNVDATDLLEHPLRLSPLAWPLAYTWPVHRIGPGSIPDAPAGEPVRLVAWRDREDKVRFLQVNAASARLLALLDVLTDSTPAIDAVRALARELDYRDEDHLVSFASELLHSWYEKDILLLGPTGSS